MKVLYPMYYALTMKCYNGQLQRGVYSIGFEEYVKAGLAFNTRGRDGVHKTQVYGDLLRVLERDHSLDSTATGILENGIKLFYEDIVYLYLRLVTALYKSERNLNIKAAAGDVLLIADFTDSSVLLEQYNVESVKIGQLCLSDKMPREVVVQAPAVTLLSNSSAGELISLYSLEARSESPRLLEVTL